MTKKQTRLLGMVLVVIALLVLTLFLPRLFPSRMSRSGFTIVKHHLVVRMAMGYLVTGMAAGFGVALVLWPFGGKEV